MCPLHRCRHGGSEGPCLGKQRGALSLEVCHLGAISHQGGERAYRGEWGKACRVINDYCHSLHSARGLEGGKSFQVSAQGVPVGMK